MNISLQSSNPAALLAQAVGAMDARVVVRSTVGSSLGQLDCLSDWQGQDEFYRGTPWHHKPAHLACGIKLVMDFVQACQNAEVLIAVALEGKTRAARQLSSVIMALGAIKIDAHDLQIALQSIEHEMAMLRQARDLQISLRTQGMTALDELSGRLCAGYGQGAQSRALAH